MNAVGPWDALTELQTVLSRIRSDGPLMDGLTAEGPWWWPPDPMGVRLYEAIIAASEAVDRALATREPRHIGRIRATDPSGRALEFEVAHRADGTITIDEAGER